MILHIIRHDGIDLHAIVQESHAALPVDLHFGHVFDPVLMLKGVWIQEGSLHELCYTLGTSSWGSWVLSSSSEGPGLPSSMLSPPGSLTAHFLLRLSPAGSCR